MNEVNKAIAKFAATVLVGSAIGAGVAVAEIRYKRYKDTQHANKLAEFAQQAAKHIREELAERDHLTVELYAIQQKLEIKSRRIEYPFSSTATYVQVGDTIDLIIDAAVAEHLNKVAPAQ